MAKKFTYKAVRGMVEELLALHSAVERYKELEGQIKEGLVALKFNEVEFEDKGRVFISISERVNVPLDVAIRELGQELADKVIVIKKSVSNEIVKAFVKAGEISEEQREKLLAGAEKTPVTNLYVRPLK